MGYMEMLGTMDQTFQKGSAETKAFMSPGRGKHGALPTLACGLEVLTSWCRVHPASPTPGPLIQPTAPPVLLGRLPDVCLSPSVPASPLRVLSSWPPIWCKIKGSVMKCGT